MKFKKAYKILKFNCDKGVRRNNGRVGAAEGPDKILVVLKKKNTLQSLQAAGFKNQNLEQYQEAFAQRIAEIKNNNQNIITIGLGGGHEIAYAHY